ncbi:MAG: arginine--tRNA ligase [candidate division FCPU426 bacterium]
MNYLADQVVEKIKNTVARLEADGAIPAGLDIRPEVERPANPAFGDFSCNFAMRYAKQTKKPPLVVAQAAADLLRQDPDIESAEGVKPGFVNLRLSPRVLMAECDHIRRLGADYGRSDAGRGRRLLLEFVSANPTGPLNIVSARAAAVGDSLARILRSQGVDVATEYYVNDAGNQAQLLGASLLARYRQSLGEAAEVPEEGYQGEYVAELAGEIAREQADAIQAARAGQNPQARLLALFREQGISKIVGWHQRDLQSFEVQFDAWFREQHLVTPPDGSGIRTFGEVIEDLQARGHLFEQDGALWFRSTAFGDDKDRVVKKSDGSFTYLATDIAYHVHKYARGYAELVDIWGPDHHGYIPRMKAAMQALGHPPEAFRVLIAQQVNLFEAGQPVAMSKRAGKFVTMADLVREVGRDVARFFFLMRATSAHLDFDLDLARKHTEDNPVYYVQYAYARICSILSKAADENLAAPAVDQAALAGHAPAAEELALARELAAFPETLAACAVALEPHGLAFYLRDLATLFHRFYTVCRVLDAGDPETSRSRLALVQAVRQVLQNGLSLLGISAPQTM